MGALHPGRSTSTSRPSAASTAPARPSTSPRSSATPAPIAVSDLPLTLVVERPDGVEYLRETLSDGGLGGYSADVQLEAEAMRGSWQVRLYADPKGSSLAETSVLVEDFQPERLAFDLVTEAKSIGTTTPAVIDLTARYLYGATAPGLSIDGDIDIRPAATLAGFDGYHFGLADEQIDPIRDPIDLGAVTDEDGKATLEVGLPELPVADQAASRPRSSSASPTPTAAPSSAA